MEAGRHAQILAANVLRRLEELELTRQQLSQRSGVSISFLSELTAGRANPSVRVLEALAEALEMSVPGLLTELEPLPPGYEHVSVVLPKERTAAVQRWAAEAEGRIRKRRT
jgi:transcriptional regulator with XRE-family HTH domain